MIVLIVMSLESDDVMSVVDEALIFLHSLMNGNSFTG